jgi:tetratricopeptide (TPR) repeat protein
VAFIQRTAPKPKLSEPTKVEAIETLARDQIAPPVERLAHHALQGEVWDKALTYCQQAGEKAMARSAYREAEGFFEQALNAIPHLPEQHDTRAQAIDLRLALGTVLGASGHSRRTLAALRKAEALAEALGDPDRLGQVSPLLSYQFYLMGSYDQSIAAAQRALALATMGGDTVLQVLVNEYLGVAYQARGDYCRAIDYPRQTLVSLNGVRSHERFGRVFLPSVLSHAYLAWSHAELGMFAEGQVLGAEGLRIAEAVGQPGSLMVASWGIGLLFLRQGNLPRALPKFERAMGLCQDVDIPLWLPRVATVLGAAYSLAGRAADAVPMLMQAMERMTATEMGSNQVHGCLSLGEAHLRAGHLEEAHAIAKPALALAQEHQKRGHQAYALRLLG